VISRRISGLSAEGAERRVNSEEIHFTSDHLPPVTYVWRLVLMFFSERPVYSLVARQVLYYHTSAVWRSTCHMFGKRRPTNG